MNFVSLSKLRLTFIIVFIFSVKANLYSLAPSSSNSEKAYPEELIVQQKKLQDSKAKFSILETDDGYLVVNHKGMSLIGFYGKGDNFHPNVIDQGRGNYPSFSQRLSIDKETGALKVQTPEGNFDSVSYFNPKTQSHNDVKFDTLDNETEHEYIFRHGPLRMIEADNVKVSANEISGTIDLNKINFPGMPDYYKNFSFVFSYILEGSTVHMDVEVRNNGEKDICFPGYLYHNTINTALPEIAPEKISIQAMLEKEWPKNTQTLIVENPPVSLTELDARIRNEVLIEEFLPKEGNGGLDKIFVLEKGANKAFVQLGDYSLEISFQKNLPFLAIWAITEGGVVKLAMEGTDAPAGGISLGKNIFSAPVIKTKATRRYRLSLQVHNNKSGQNNLNKVVTTAA